jgi:hypothetical protein
LTRLDAQGVLDTVQVSQLNNWRRDSRERTFQPTCIPAGRSPGWWRRADRVVRADFHRRADAGALHQRARADRGGDASAGGTRCGGYRCAERSADDDPDRRYQAGEVRQGPDGRGSGQGRKAAAGGAAPSGRRSRDQAGRSNRQAWRDLASRVHRRGRFSEHRANLVRPFAALGSDSHPGCAARREGLGRQR